MRALVLAAWTVLGLVSPALAAPKPPPLIVFHAPDGEPAEIAAVRDALVRLARAAGTAFLDLSPPPPAPPAAPAHLRRAIEAYDALRYDEALAALEQGVAEAAATGAAGLEPAELSDLLLYRALVHTQRSDGTRAWEDFVRAATVDPTRRLDPYRFPPRTVEAFQRAVDQVRAARRGTLTVEAPAGCTVAVDGRDVTAAPPKLPHGEHYVRVECPGAPAWGARVVLAEDAQRLAAAPAAPAAPTTAEIAQLARTRGSAAVVWAEVTASPGAPPTVWLRLVDAATGAVKQQSVVALATGGAATPDAEAAAKRLVETEMGVLREPEPRVIVRQLPPEPVPWYKRPWFWGAVGVAAATVVLVPLLVEDLPPDSLEIRPGGLFQW